MSTPEKTDPADSLRHRVWCACYEIAQKEDLAFAIRCAAKRPELRKAVIDHLALHAHVDVKDPRRAARNKIYRAISGGLPRPSASRKAACMSIISYIDSNHKLPDHTSDLTDEKAGDFYRALRTVVGLINKNLRDSEHPLEWRLDDREA